MALLRSTAMMLFATVPCSPVHRLDFGTAASASLTAGGASPVASRRPFAARNPNPGAAGTQTRTELTDLTPALAGMATATGRPCRSPAMVSAPPMAVWNPPDGAARGSIPTE